jgi:hypothetical protein
MLGQMGTIRVGYVKNNTRKLQDKTMEAGG